MATNMAIVDDENMASKQSLIGMGLVLPLFLSSYSRGSFPAKYTLYI